MTNIEIDRYVIKCPSCGSTFDCAKEIDKWKLALADATDFLKQMKEVLKFSIKLEGGKGNEKEKKI